MVTGFLQGGETGGEIAVLRPLTGCVASSVLCSEEHWVWSQLLENSGLVPVSKV